MKALIHVLCAAVAFVAVDMWKAPAAFAVQQLKKASQWVSKAKKKKTRSHRKSAHREQLREHALEMLRIQSQSLWDMVNGVSPSPDTSLTAEVLEGEDPEELAREDNVPVDMETFRQLWLSYMEGTAVDELTAAGVSKRAIMDFILDWLGTPYRFGGTSATGIDCSGFIRCLFAEVVQVWLPRTAALQYTLGLPVRREELQFGDLVFFHTRRHAYVSHVGIYLGDDLFAHASSRGGVTISSLRSTYYSKRFVGARRLTEHLLRQLAAAPEMSEKVKMGE